MRILIATFLLAGGLAACGGGSPSGGTPPAGSLAPGAGNAKQVIYSQSSAGCLLTHNADNEVNFLLGDKPAKYLGWFCADHGNHDLRQTRILFAYDYDQACFTDRLTVMDFARCTTNTSPPSNPFIAVSLASFTASTGRNGQNLPGFDCRATISNAGNIPALGIDYELRIAGGSPITVGTIAVIEPQSSVTIEHCDTYSAALAGQTIALELDLRDMYARSLLERPAVTSITIP